MQKTTKQMSRLYEKRCKQVVGACTSGMFEGAGVLALLRLGLSVGIGLWWASAPRTRGMSLPEHVHGSGDQAGMTAAVSEERAVSISEWMDNPASKTGEYINHRSGGRAVHPSNHGNLRHNPRSVAKALSGTGEVDPEILDAARIHKLQDMVSNTSPVDGWTPNAARKREASRLLRKIGRRGSTTGIRWPEWVDKEGPLVFRRSTLRTPEDTRKAVRVLDRIASRGRIGWRRLDKEVIRQARQIRNTVAETGRLPARLPNWLQTVVRDGRWSKSELRGIVARRAPVEEAAGLVAAGVVVAIVVSDLRAVQADFDAARIDARECERRKSVAVVRGIGEGALFSGGLLLIALTPVGPLAGGVLLIVGTTAISSSGVYDWVGSQWAAMRWERGGRARFEKMVDAREEVLAALAADRPSYLRARVFSRRDWAKLGFDGIDQYALIRLSGHRVGPLRTDTVRNPQPPARGRDDDSTRCHASSEIREEASFFRTGDNDGRLEVRETNVQE